MFLKYQFSEVYFWSLSYTNVLIPFIHFNLKLANDDTLFYNVFMLFNVFTLRFNVFLCFSMFSNLFYYLEVLKNYLLPAGRFSNLEICGYSTPLFLSMAIVLHLGYHIPTHSFMSLVKYIYTKNYIFCNNTEGNYYRFPWPSKHKKWHFDVLSKINVMGFIVKTLKLP